ncbi:TetR/AcrR family transcriptional regulator [Kribbella sp. C-35]|uniref:TetR/AcrR family transcriptional regulator n=1 Tax=Kribbella sp. C-35 TaxID=2789276 RepID=UPI00397DD196
MSGVGIWAIEQAWVTKMRLTAAERGEEVLGAAIQAFGRSGYAGTKTDEIARLAGVSQPYVIRLFGTKQQLFLAAVEAVCDTVEPAAWPRRTRG